MRFLLKPSSPSIISKSHVSSRLSAAAPASVSVSAASPDCGAATSSSQDAVGVCKTWAQQCGNNCGCVLRFEAQLLESPSSTSPTIVRATYHAKRVMASASTTGKDDQSIRLTPLTNQRSQPMLTSCTCPTLHHIAKQAVEHLNGKTLAQLRNEMNMGVVGIRSSVAYRHTVILESVLPTIADKLPKKFGITKKEAINQNANNLYAETYNSTQQHFHCYDLVEGSLLSMIHARMPSPRNDNNNAESYSPTLGEYFRMYSSSGRRQSSDVMGYGNQDENASSMENEYSFIHETSDWQRRSPSSFFLFGGDETSNSTPSMTQVFIQQLKDSISDRLLGNEIKKDKTDDRRPTTSYLKLLDMYGIDNSNQIADNTVDDWVEFVDRNNYHQGDLA